MVAGCLPQRFRDDLPKLMPEVDAQELPGLLGDSVAAVEGEFQIGKTKRKAMLEMMFGSVQMY